MPISSRSGELTHSTWVRGKTLRPALWWPRYPLVLRTLSSFWAQVTGDTINDFVLSLIKDTQIRERLRFQFRAKFFNAMNRPQFGNPSVSPTDRNYDRITNQINDPRKIQFGFKLYF